MAVAPRAPAVLPVESTFITMTCAAILLPLILLVRFWMIRFHPRKSSKAALAEDGFVLFAAAISETSFVYGSIYLARNLKKTPNAGAIEPSQDYMIRFWATISFVTVIGKLTAMYAVKAAFLCFYWRLYDQATGLVKMWPIKAAAALLMVAWVGSAAGYITACLPGNIYGDPTCVAVLSIQAHTVSTILYVSSDICLVWLPLRIIRQLHAASSEAVAIGFIFLLGGISVAATISRFALLLSFGMLNHKAAPETTKGLSSAMADGSYANMAIIGVVTEVLAGFVALMLVTMRPVLDWMIAWAKRVFWWQSLPERTQERIKSLDGSLSFVGQGGPEMGEVRMGTGFS